MRPSDCTEGKSLSGCIIPAPQAPGNSSKSRRQAADGLSILLIDKRPMLRDCLAKALSAIGQNIDVRQAAEPEDVRTVDGAVSLCLLASGTCSVEDDWVRCAMAELQGVLPEVPILMLADRLDLDDIINALDAGVRGYLTTEMDLRIMVEAARLVCSGGVYVPAEAIILRKASLPRSEQGLRALRGSARGPAMGENGLFEAITPREFDVLMRLRQGKPNKIIAHELNMRESTVKVHVQSIMRKLGATNRTQVSYLTQSYQLSAAEGEISADVA